MQQLIQLIIKHKWFKKLMHKNKKFHLILLLNNPKVQSNKWIIKIIKSPEIKVQIKSEYQVIKYGEMQQLIQLIIKHKWFKKLMLKNKKFHWILLLNNPKAQSNKWIVIKLVLENLPKICH